MIGGFWSVLLLLGQVGGPSMDMDRSAMDLRDNRPAEAEQETDPVKYRAKAKALYLRAQDLLQRDLGIEAGQTFRLVIEKYPFSRYAILAEFGHAQALAAQGESEGALAGFTRFLKQHPGHPKTVDVRHAIVTTNWSERPGNFFLLPPAFERDLEDVRGAVIAANAFLKSHGEDQRAKSVRQIKRKARRLLYQQAVFLARWTDQQGRPHAALERWKLARQAFAEQAASDKDAQWAKNLTTRVAGTSIEHPEEPKLHPAASVIGGGDRP